jgi:hypothetical protein
MCVHLFVFLCMQASAGVGAQRAVLAAAWLPALTQQQQVTFLLGLVGCGAAAKLSSCVQ